MMKIVAANDEPQFAAGEATQQIDVRPGEATVLLGRSLEREADRQWWLGATDFGRRGLAIASIASPALQGRWAQAIGAGCSQLLAHQACSIVKHVSDEERPDGSDNKSFPSSHALETFSAATSLALGFGRSIGVPAYAAAGWVAYGRLRADRHHLRDVVVGGLAGAAFAWASAKVAGRLGRAVSGGHDAA